MDIPPRRSSNVHANLRAGLRLWRSSGDDPGVLMMVNYEHGLATATVHDGEDAGEVLQVKDMGGSFEDPPRVS